MSLLTFVADTPPERVEEILAALRGLPDVVPGLRDYRVGPDAGLDRGNADFVVVADFDDEDGYCTYRDHPEHVAVLRDLIRPVLAARSAAQYTI